MKRSDLRTEIRKFLRDIDSGNYYWTDGQINTSIERQLLSSYLRQEATKTYSINAGLREFTLPDNFKEIYRLRLKDTSGEESEVTSHYEIWKGILQFFEDLTTGYTLVLKYLAEPDKPADDNAQIDVKNEQLDLLKMYVVRDLIKEDTRPTWEMLKIFQVANSEIARLENEVGTSEIL